MIKDAFIILGIAAAASLISAFVHPKRPAWYSVENTSDLRWSLSVDQAKEMSKSADSILWIDARLRSDYAKGSIDDAILLNTDEWADLMFKHQNTLQDTGGKPIIVYCDGADCDKSKVVANRLRDLIGLESVFVLKGDWREISN